MFSFFKRNSDPTQAQTGKLRIYAKDDNKTYAIDDQGNITEWGAEGPPGPQGPEGPPGPPGTTVHNDTTGIQGGAPGDYQHLTTAEKNQISTNASGVSQNASDISDLQTNKQDNLPDGTFANEQWLGWNGTAWVARFVDFVKDAGSGGALVDAANSAVFTWNALKGIFHKDVEFMGGANFLGTAPRYGSAPTLGTELANKNYVDSVASTPDHNNLNGLNAGTTYLHLTQAEKDTTAQGISDNATAISGLQSSKQDNLPNGVAVTNYLGWSGVSWIARNIDYSEIQNTPTTPNLQQVTDVGNTTTNPLLVNNISDSFGLNMNSDSGYPRFDVTLSGLLESRFGYNNSTSKTMLESQNTPIALKQGVTDLAEFSSSLANIKTPLKLDNVGVSTALTPLATDASGNVVDGSSLIPTDADFVTTNSTQSGLSGDKTWSGLHTFSSGLVANQGGNGLNVYLGSSGGYIGTGASPTLQTAFLIDATQFDMRYDGASKLRVNPTTTTFNNDLYKFVDVITNTPSYYYGEDSSGNLTKFTPTIPTDSDYVTTNTNQIGLSGDKTTSGTWTMPRLKVQTSTDYIDFLSNSSAPRIDFFIGGVQKAVFARYSDRVQIATDDLFQVGSFGSNNVFSVNTSTSVLNHNGRMLVNGATDDGSNALQVDGITKADSYSFNSSTAQVTTDASNNLFLNFGISKYAKFSDTGFELYSFGSQVAHWTDSGEIYADNSIRTRGDFKFDVAQKRLQFATNSTYITDNASGQLQFGCTNGYVFPNVPTGTIVNTYGEDSSGNLVKASGGGGSTLKYYSTFNIANTTTSSGITSAYYATKVVPLDDMSVTKMEAYIVTGGGSGTLRMGIYNSAGTLQAQGSVALASQTGLVEVTLGSTVNLTGGEEYWFAITDGAGAANYGNQTGVLANNFLTRTGFLTAGNPLPSTLGGSGTGSSFYIGAK